MDSYYHFYDRTIQQHTTGFKLVIGGTGLGKTSGIKELVHSPDYQNRKFIYCANRKQLIDEMAQSLDTSSYAVLYRDLEVVLLTLKEHRSDFYELLDSSLFQDNLKRWNDKSKLRRIDLPTVKRACKELEDMLFVGTSIPKLLEARLDDYAGIVLSAFRSVLLAANNKRGNSPSYEKLADHPVVQSLFPFIAFIRCPEIRVLLVTLQKAFYGFFDGKKTLNLTNLHESYRNFVIFLDEFDFLENDLVGLICRAPQISNPFRFVGLFYNAMAWHKLPLETYPLSEDIRDRIKEIKDLITPLRDEGLRFPEINQFTSTLPQLNSAYAIHSSRKEQRTPAIFRTRHIINTDPLYIQLTERSFELITEQDATKQSYSALRLFDIISYATERILILFKELEKFDEIIYREVLRHCFQDTIFPEQMRLVSQFARASHEQTTQLGTLLDTGYSLYDIDDLQQRTDRDEVEVRHYGMSLTPEMILRSLAQHNLVFGLSATADIERYVHNFDLNWLGQQVNIIARDEEDIRIIQELNNVKAIKRDNHITMAVLDDLDVQDDYQYKLEAFLSAVATDEDFGQDTSFGHLKRRVQLFFSALLWLSSDVQTRNDSQQSTCLLFLNTFRQIKLVFDRYQRQEEQLFEITKREGNLWFDVYEIALRNRKFIVIFYNSQFALQRRQNQQAQQAFDTLFWEGKPVVIVTQYLSAGNGVNLQYRPDKGSKEQDFTHIGLLETPYFYFSKPDPELPWDERISALKENIWYQAKLFASKSITERRFRQVLSTLNSSNEWNRRYQMDLSTAKDALFNNIATFMQALGRVERVWTKTPDQTVLFNRDVYHCFQAYCSPEYELERAERANIISANLQQTLIQVENSLPQQAREVRRNKDARLEAKDERCRQLIQQLLIQLEELRQGNSSSNARVDWVQLRKSGLKHDFGDDVLQKYGCVVESPYYSRGILYLTPQNEILPARLTQPDTYLWRMNALYDMIERNRVIRDYFLSHGYELAFGDTGKQFFTPYFYQAILAGAVGEEAITALFDDEDISLEEIPDALFEVADLKIHNQPWYVDCKNYNEFTLERFTVSSNDPAWHPKLNEVHFKQNARKKVEKISRYHGEQGKVIYINLVSSHERPFDYFDDDFQRVSSFAESTIVVVQGALQRSTPNNYQQAFEYLLQDIKTQSSQGEA